MTLKPRIAITIGDAAGIGPEVTLKAIENRDFSALAEITLVGDAAHLSAVASRFCKAGKIPAVAIEDLANLPSEVVYGVDSAQTGKAAAENIVRAVELWKAGKIEAIVTAPISKNAIKLGGFDFPGHTEFLAHLTNTKEFAMSFFAGPLRVALLSTHLPLTQAIEFVTAERVSDLIRFCDREFSRLLGRRPSIAVAGINPHASEGGRFGFEERDEITPAIVDCRAASIEVTGPHPADTVFHNAMAGKFDVVVAMYHDQATIPVKTVAFDRAVNVTLGLPVIRTSVDHGTAYDIAGNGTASAENMIAAIDLAIELVRAAK
ncbi:MAG: 4-hydroxythreonine-4-phosphate dehydrogenase [Acidobacteria bacterium OLB17]|nr:MAG: 4-hydroxythreonine-4-phosphate dehydrogenase [Acidobacteria bacterium OLB17]MCZ2391902.1 4-hydroxythreonine-4-phosphate dehydrogenase PdxA [Acidobacteriota bacterium]